MESRTVPRQPREEPPADAPDVPQPTQVRADYIKEQAHTGDPGPIAPPRNVDVPYVGGDATVGGTLNCTMGNWQGMDTGTYAYAWASDGTPNAAAGSAYTVVIGDAGHSITCIVTATNEAGSTAAPPSNAVAIAAAQTESSRRK
jgi:hypothetical protein